MESVKNRLRLKFIKEDDTKNFFKQQSKLTFNGIHKSYEMVIVVHSNKMKS